MSSGTMGGLSVGVSGLQTSQYALNATAHNLTNTQTSGYSRQQVLLTDMSYNKIARDGTNVLKSGLGVVTSTVRQVRDKYADAAYRRENGRMTYYKAQYETTSEIENYFGELEGEDFNTSINDLWLSLQELQKEPNSIVTRSSFISTAQTFLDRVQGIRESLVNYQSNLNSEIKAQISRINELSSEIVELNDKILSSEASGLESANDYRDQRNADLDELSGLIKTEVVNNVDGTVEVFAEGRCLVTKGKAYQMDCIRVIDNENYNERYDFVSDSQDFLMPVWKDDYSEVFNITKTPSTQNNTDLGSLKGLIMSRGYFVSNYTDVPVSPEKPLADDYEDDADYQEALEQYQLDLKQYTKDLDYFNTYVEPYTITNLMAQFDVLVNAMVTGINDTLCPNKEVTLADGSTVKILDEDSAGIGMGNGNEIAGTELFTRNGISRYTEQEITLEDGTTITAQVYNEENTEDYSTLYTTAGISVNEKLLQNPSLLPLSRQSGEEAQEVVDALLDRWNDKFATVSPNKLVGCNYKDYYAGMIEDLSDRGYTYNAMATAQEQSVNEWDNQRQQVVGVSSDEELSNMIRFQHAYNASSRYINTVAEMIEYLIEKLG
jgi:flagellar hook-associated protein 1 FlgK